MFLLSNNSCIWTKNVCRCFVGKTADTCTENAYLVEIKRKDFNRVKTYDNNFRNFDIKNEIKCYEDLIDFAEYQQSYNVVLKINNFEQIKFPTVEEIINPIPNLEMHYFDTEDD